MSGDAERDTNGRLGGRYTLGRCLGAGTFGVVYEAREESRGTRVALKKLSEADAGAIYAFKQEFRALADVVHPNLVGLKELISVDGQLYLSMELIEGESFLDYVRDATLRQAEIASLATIELTDSLDAAGSARIARAATAKASGANASAATMDVSAATANATAALADASAEAASRETLAVDSERGKAAIQDPTRLSDLPFSGGVNVERLRASLRQLAGGVHAIHSAGKLHRDIKPSNVLVTAEGRVAILDFGLVASVPMPGARESLDRRVVGTPAYMSPEQGFGAPLTPASDWYSLGVMIYEALSGRLPITGTIAEILAKKHMLDPPDPRVLVAGLPDDLCDLCVALLRREPQERPTGPAVLSALGTEMSAMPADAAPWAEALPFIGREHHLAMLEEAFTTTCKGRAVTVHAHGTSGMGKSALLRRFLDGIEQRHGGVVLEGRCYERESVPYKAVDSLIDALTQHLRELPASEIELLIPRDVGALARLFPVLRRVEAFAVAPARAEAPDPLELRRRAFASLREILTRMATRRPLVICIDDLQWGDVDSAALLIDLLEPPDPPPLLLIASYRSEDVATIELVRVTRERLARGELVSDVRELVVGPLAHREARALARVLLAGESLDVHADVEQIALESAGSPLFVHELARHVRTVASSVARLPSIVEAPRVISLQDALTGRVARLPAEARLLLETIAVAGRPIAGDSACIASGLAPDAQALAVLRAEHLVRGRGSRIRLEVETFHDRIRETVLGGLAPAVLAERHGRIAVTLEAEGDADPEALFVHFSGAGDTDRARHYVEIAAERAERALAFDRAAALHRRAIELRGADVPQSLRARLAHALANAGRGAEAARAYLDAIEGAPSGDVLDLRRRAAEQFLRSGHVDEGITVIRDVLATVDLSLPKTPARALASLVLRRAQLSLRGLAFDERSASQILPADLTRIDVCWAVGAGLGGTDVVRAADFQARHLLYALRAGEPYRISRALAWEAIFAAMEGGVAGRRRAASLVARSTELAQRIAHPHATAWAAGAAAGAAFYDYRFKEAVDLSEKTLALFREGCADITWEVGSILGWWQLPGLYFLGEIGELARRIPVCLREARELGALYNETALRTYTLPRVLLAADKPAEARRESADAMHRWSQDGFHTQHLCDMFAQAFSYLYEGNGVEAHLWVEQCWPPLKRSLLLRVEVPVIESHHLRGICALAAAAQGHDRERLLNVADRAARALVQMKLPFAQTFASVLEAGLAVQRGRPDLAARRCEEAATGFDALDMAFHAACARRRGGELLGGDAGGALMRAADAWMNGQGIRNPERMAAIVVPA